MKKIYLLSLIFLIVSCRDEQKPNDEFSVMTENYFIRKEQVLDIAEQIGSPVVIHSKKNYLDKREILNITPFGDSAKPSFYVVNYKDNRGYIIVSGDNRIEPILAFSHEGNISNDLNKVPPMLLDWMYCSSASIERIRLSNSLYPISNNERSICNQRIISYIQSSFSKEFPNEQIPEKEERCECYYKEIPILMKTNWHQYSPYNKLVKKICNSGKAPAGCVAIATSQIIKYYEFPYNFNWTNMDNPYIYEDASSLIAYVGELLNTNYDCEGSGAQTSNIPKVLKKLGYKSADYGDYDYNRVVNELNNNNPVILSGKKGLLKEGHAWVCDAYYSINICFTCAKKDGGVAGRSLFLHMNWG